MNIQLDRLTLHRQGENSWNRLVEDKIAVPRSALEVVTAYIKEVWNEGKVNLIGELCADPVVRHDANTVTELSHAEQVERITHNFEELHPFFEDVILAGDDQHITLLWNVTGRDPNWKWCGIEVFRVTNGKIAEVWNAPYLDGSWGMSRTLAGRLGESVETALPVMTLDVTDRTAEAVVPADARNIGRWLAQILGTPDTSKVGNALWQHDYIGNDALPFALTMQDANGPSLALDAVKLTRLHIGWARSGLVNATISATGEQGAPSSGTPGSPQPAPTIVRLAEPIGQFLRQGKTLGRVVNATIEIGTDSPRATGSVTLRVPGSFAEISAIGTGDLSFGWRAGDFSLTFNGVAELGEPDNLFTHNNEIEFTCTWAAGSISATIINDSAS